MAAGIKTRIACTAGNKVDRDDIEIMRCDSEIVLIGRVSFYC